MKASDYVVDFISSLGTTHGYFMIGGALGHLADSFARKGFPLYTLHHEQAAAFAAESQAAVTRGYGLAMATSGPGATNLVTGIGSAFFASLPVIFITGQVNTFESNADGKRRQVGFQETDIVSIVKSITKYAVQVRDAGELAYHLEKAAFLAKDGRMGPVLIDIPFDVQRSELDLATVRRFSGSAEHKALSAGRRIDAASFGKVAGLIASSERPMLLIGHGVRLADAEKEALELIEKTGMPFVVSLMGTDCVPNDHPLFQGFIGTYGRRSSNFALANSDLVLAIGSRLDSRQVGVQRGTFAPMARIVHVDIDQSELGSSVKEHLSIHADAKEFLKGLLPIIGERRERKEWLGFLDGLRKRYGMPAQDIGPDEIDPVEAIGRFSEVSKEGDVIGVDVGSNQMWFAQGWKAKRGHTILTDGGMGPMGCALPYGIGASMARGGAPAWVFAGDGGFQINIQELQTVKRHALPLKMIVINNQALGMLTQFQTENFEGRLIGSVDGYDAPDFVEVARAYGIPARRVERRSGLDEAVRWVAREKGPCLLDVKVPRAYWTTPKSTYSKPVHDMAPFLGREEYEKALKYVDRRFLQRKGIS